MEIGSYRGRSAAAWYQGIEDRGSLFCVDSWDADYPEGRPSDFEIFNEQMAIMNYAPTVMRMPSVEAVEMLAPGCIDIVFIDGNHAEAGLDIDYWLPKLKLGGLICGHDWRRGGELERQVIERLPEAKLIKGSIWAWRKTKWKPV